jgi:hypothetical protein
MSSRIACALCGQHHWEDSMTEREGALHCEMCAALPPYSDALYNAIVGFQRLFKQYFKKKAHQCFNCEMPSLTLYEFQGGKVCGGCYDDLHEREQEEHRDCPGCGHYPCRCEDDGGWCENCECPHGCVCAEQEEDARLRRHRKICGFPDCEGGCGTLDCGCVDKCKCPLDYGDDESGEWW